VDLTIASKVRTIFKDCYDQLQISIWRGDFGWIRGRTREQPEAYLYGTLRIATAENEESGRKRPPKSKAYELSGLKMGDFSGTPNLFCITDVGSTTTKAILFVRDGEWKTYREEVATTVEKPHEDVTVGVINALHALEKSTGVHLVSENEPSIPYLSTSSAGGGLAMVVTGLVRDITAESAHRVALGAGAVVLDVIAMNDSRTPYRKIEDLKLMRPDLVLLAGGFDGDAVSGPVFLAELLVESELRPKLNPHGKLPVIYGGNSNAKEYVERALGDRYMMYPVPNIRPAGDQENLEPARNAIQALFMDHVMSQAPGYEVLKSWVSAPILPTPAAFAKIIGLVSKDMNARILAIDIGGATTDVFTAENGEVFRTVSANIGMSYSILNVGELVGERKIRDFLDVELNGAELWNRLGNKHINPTALPQSSDDMMIEWATATLAIREAVRAHLKVIRGSSISLDRADLEISPEFQHHRGIEQKEEALILGGYDLVIGSGGILSHSPRGAAAMMLLDALQLQGQAELAVDSTFMFPHLGVLAEVNPELAQELFYKHGFVRLGTVVTSPVEGVEGGVKPGELRLIPLAEGENLDIRSSGERGEESRVSGGVCGLMIDLRPRPVTARAGSLVPSEFCLPERKGAYETEERVYHGTIRMRRELAIPGEVFVKEGDTVSSDTLVARSTHLFLRPFFLHVAKNLEVPPDELHTYLLVNIGDNIEQYEVIAKGPRKKVFATSFKSPVRGWLEKILPDGTLVVREKPEHSREITVVNVAKELGLEPRYIKPYLRCEVGQEVDRGVWLAAIMLPGMKLCKSPVRGKVKAINLTNGTVSIEPLLEELEVNAWLPGNVEEVSDKGCVVSNQGTIVQGIWGSGGERYGTLVTDTVESKHITVTKFATRDLLAQLDEVGAAGLITGGLNIQDVLELALTYTIVVIEGFGEQRIDDRIYGVLEAHRGKLALLDGTTQLRVGVKRPKVILPNPTS
jgi:uncharacterized protein (TIGR01319 family)